MPPRINSHGCYTDEGTVDHDGKLVPYTPEQIEATRAHETAHGIPSTIPDDVVDEKAETEVVAIVSDEAETADEAEES